MCSLVNSKICISFPKGTFYLIGPVHNDSLTGLVTRWFGCLLTVMDCKRGICRQAGHVVVQLAGVAVGRGHCVDGGARGGARGGDRLSS